MNVNCTAKPCPVILDATCVFYSGGKLLYTGVKTNDNLQIALEKIDAKFRDANIGYIFENGIIQSSPGQPVKLGGSLTGNTTINSAGFTFALSGTIESQAFITTGGTSSQFVKGDGSLDSTSYQPSGNYITALTGDGTASGPGSAVFTLSNSGVVANTYGSASQVPVITVDAKGRVTNVNNTPINYPPQLLFFSGDVWGAGQTASNVTLTLNNVNSGVFPAITPLKFSVNAKGLVTGAAPLTNLDIFSLLGYTPVPQTRTLTINGQTYDLSANRSWTVSGLPSQIGNSGKFLTTNGSIASWATIPLPTASALTKTDDTNVTLTLGGSPNTALLAATSLTLGWTGTLADSRITSAATWNAKQDAITLTTLGTSGPATFIANTLNIPQYQTALTNPVTGTGTTNYLSKWSSTSSLTDSLVFDDGTSVNVSVGVSNPSKNILSVENLGTGTYKFAALGIGTLWNDPSGTNLADIRISNANTTGIRIYASETELTPTPSGAGFQFFKNSDPNYSGKVFFDSGANNNAAIIWRTAPTATLITERMRLDAFGDVTIANLATGGAAQMVTSNATGKLGIQTIPLGTVTSVGLSMPSAFTVTSSPVTSSGTLTVTGAGLASQYIRGDGQLATLPSSPSGGGASISYYLNGSVNDSVATYKQLSKNPIIGPGTNFSTSTDGLIAQFLTDPGDPNVLNIPGGSWLLDFYFSASTAGGTPNFYAELYKYDGTTFTLIASNSATPEFITNGTSIDFYTTSISVPTTALTLTDRLAVRVYVACDGRTITLHTENNNLCEIVTTLSTGISALNGLIAQVQFFATGTSGADFNINSATATHTFNLPVASAVNTGKLSSTDWSTFNSKQNALSFGNLTETVSSVLTITGGTGAVVGSGTSIQVDQASSVQDGFLSSTDWTTFNNKPTTFYQNTQPTGTGTSSIIEKSFWTHSDTGLQYTYIYDGNTYQWVQVTLPLGPQGPQGSNGTNTINSLTATTFNGILKGNGATISATTVLTELGYTPEDVANKETIALDTSNIKYPTNNVVTTALNNFSDDVDYAIMTNQRILFNF